ncbi:MAG: hypothetical protein JO352_32530 [Chloroflexi bacterium]|nr:hypothetical protein [Chloroflexota bacterium]
MPRHGDNIRKRTIVKRRLDGTEYTLEFWTTDVDLGVDPFTGKRQRKTLSGDTYAEVDKARRKLVGDVRDRGLKSHAWGQRVDSQLVV